MAQTNSLSYNGPKQGFTTDKFIWNDSVKTFDRFGKYLGCKVYFIKEGYQGMVDGGSNIVEAEWSSVSGIINKGGTVIALLVESWRGGRFVNTSEQCKTTFEPEELPGPCGWYLWMRLRKSVASWWSSEAAYGNPACRIAVQLFCCHNIFSSIAMFL